MGHPGAREHDRMCFVGHDASPVLQEIEKGAPWCTYSLPPLHYSNRPAKISGSSCRQQKQIVLGLGLGLGLLKFEHS